MNFLVTDSYWVSILDVLWGQQKAVCLFIYEKNPSLGDLFHSNEQCDKSSVRLFIFGKIHDLWAYLFDTVNRYVQSKYGVLP